MFGNYNPYLFNNGYQNNMNANPYQQPNITNSYQQQGQFSQSQYSQQQLTMNTNKLYATSLDDVKSKQLAPNSDYLFLDNDKPLLYRKVVDSTGKMFIETYQLSPYEDKPTIQPTTIDMSQYVLKSDFEELKKQIDKLSIPYALEKTSEKQTKISNK